MEEFGMENGWMQEYDGSAFYYRPDFSNSETPFHDIRAVRRWREGLVSVPTDRPADTRSAVVMRAVDGSDCEPTIADAMHGKQGGGNGFIATR